MEEHDENYQVIYSNDEDFFKVKIEYNLNDQKKFTIMNLFNTTNVTKIQINDTSLCLQWLDIFTKNAKLGLSRGLCISGLSHAHESFFSFKKKLKRDSHSNEIIHDNIVLKTIIQAILFPLKNIYKRSTGIKKIYK
jgi:hypothetical protein